MIESIPRGESVVLGADFNGQVGEGNRGDEKVMGTFGVKDRNLKGPSVADFAKRMEIGVVNTYFQKTEEPGVTYKSGGRSTQSDYILCRRGNLRKIRDCKVVAAMTIAKHHRKVGCKIMMVIIMMTKEEREDRVKNHVVEIKERRIL